MTENLFNDNNTIYFNNINLNYINIVNNNDNNNNINHNINNINNKHLKHKLADMIFDIKETIPDSLYKEMLETVAKIN